MSGPSPRRRRLLLAGLALALGGPLRPAQAQEAEGAAPAPAPTPATPPSPPARPRRPPRRRTARPAPRPEPREEAAAPPPDLAPVPNRSIEPPRGAVTAENPSFGPSIIHRPLPNTSAAIEGAYSLNEERLFNPAPGARLTVPFRY